MTSTSHAVLDHSIHQETVSLGILIAPLIVVVQAIRPHVLAAAVNHRPLSVPAAKERKRSRPVPRCAIGIEAATETNTQCVRDFVEGSPFRHVAAVRPETKVTVCVGLGGGDAWVVADVDRLCSIAETVVPVCGCCHGSFDACVGIELVRGGV